MSLFQTPITINTTVVGTDRRGARTLTPGPDVVVKGHLNVMSAEEALTNGLDVGISRGTLFLPASAPISRDDTVRVLGDVWEIVGDPTPKLRASTAEVHHIEAAVKKAG